MQENTYGYEQGVHDLCKSPAMCLMPCGKQCSKHMGDTGKDLHGLCRFCMGLSQLHFERIGSNHTLFRLGPESAI